MIVSSETEIWKFSRWISSEVLLQRLSIRELISGAFIDESLAKKLDVAFNQTKMCV